MQTGETEAGLEQISEWRRGTGKSRETKVLTVSGREYQRGESCAKREHPRNLQRVPLRIQ